MSLHLLLHFIKVICNPLQFAKLAAIYFRTDTFIHCRTANVSSTIIGEALPVTVVLPSGYEMQLDETFTYRENPVIHSVEPYVSFLR